MPALAAAAIKTSRMWARRRASAPFTTALVVDDDRDVADTLVMLLQHFGVTFASLMMEEPRSRSLLD